MLGLRFSLQTFVYRSNKNCLFLNKNCTLLLFSFPADNSYRRTVKKYEGIRNRKYEKQAKHRTQKKTAEGNLEHICYNLYKNHDMPRSSNLRILIGHSSRRVPNSNA